MEQIQEEYSDDEGSDGHNIETHFEESHLQDLAGPKAHLEQGRCMGDGAYGKVYIATLKANQKAVALKVVPLDGSQQDEIEVGQEVAVLEKYSRHVNIARFYGAYRNRASDDDSIYQDELWLAMELCVYGSASALILNIRTAPDAFLPEPVMVYTCHGLLAGLEYLHSHKVLHRDVKGQNVLYSRDGVVKLCDFGVSATVKKNKGKRATVIGTPYWMAPEVIACDYGPGNDYGTECDMWSFGIFAIELAEGCPPLVDMPPMKALMQIPQLPAPTLEGSSPRGPWSDAFKDLVDASLVKDYLTRPSASDLLKHPCVTNTDLLEAQAMTLEWLAKVNPSVDKSQDNDWKSSVHVSKPAHRSNVLKALTPLPEAAKLLNDPMTFFSNSRQTNNLATVEELTEDTIIAALKARLSDSQIYTLIGDILISVNPYREVGLFTPAYQQMFGLKSRHRNLPHVYAVAQSTLRALQTLSRDQCCVISGESGAGKTETAKQFVRQVLNMAHGNNKEASKTEIFIQAMDPVLEAFGNAKTVMNDNSSRFGKYLEIKFDQNLHIKGAHMSHYLLEKSRVTHQAPGERNFHIFYYLQVAQENQELMPVQDECSYLGGRPKFDNDSTLYAQFKVEHTTRYPRVLSLKPQQSRLSAKRSTRGRMAFSQRFKRNETKVDVFNHAEALECYNRVITCLQDIGFTDSLIRGTRHLLAGVIFIGNIDFVLTDDGTLRLTSYNALFSAADLLGIDAIDLGHALCVYTQITRGEVILRDFTREQARDTRDATAKSLYNRLFNWCIKLINDKGSQHLKSATEIGVLDLFGFESFETNCFEQLCINLANEQLQGYFNAHIFDREVEELNEEGIKTPPSLTVDTKPTIDLFLQRKMGFFSILNEESFFPNASPQSLAAKLHKQYAKNKLYSAPKSAATEFTINHYAGPVTYSLLLFIEKNRDSLSHTIATLFDKSKNPIIKAMFVSDDAEDAAGRTASVSPENRKQKKKENHTHRRAHTVARAFQDSLRDMSNKLSTCQPHFIRCIKPNMSQSEVEFDMNLVKRQLRCCGVLATVQQRRDGYPVRLPFMEFVRRYKGISMPFTETVTHTDAEATTLKILEGLNVDASNAAVTKTSNWQIGKTRVFLKYFVVDQLSNQLQRLHFLATTIQRCFRNYVARKKIDELKQAGAAKILQKHVRSWLARKVAVSAAEAAAQAATPEPMVEDGIPSTVIINDDDDDDEIDDSQAQMIQELPPGTSIDQGEEVVILDDDSSIAASTEDDAKLKMPSDRASVWFADLPGSSSSSAFNSPDSPDEVSEIANKEAFESGNYTDFSEPALHEARLSTLQRPSEKQLKLQKKIRNEDRARRRAEATQRHAARQAELETAAAMKKDLILKQLDLRRYDKLEQNLVDKSKLPHGVENLNRYLNILPNPRTRVRLKQEGNDPTSQYINANYIRAFDGCPRRYIATQGPLPTTVRSFWRLVWESNSRAIVMVTGLVEKGHQKCARYWPKALYNPQLAVGDVTFGSINVRINAGFRREGFVTTKFLVQYGSEKREIWHFWFDSWPDHGVPKRYAPVLSMLESCRRWSNNPDHPWIIHCSAGIGRTGAFVAVDHGVRQFESTGVVDVISIIENIRADRGGMVQHREQAEFVQLCLDSYKQAHGAEPVDNPILQESIEKALVNVPARYEGHISQQIVDEGSEREIPTWRQEQIEYQKELRADEISNLKLEHARAAMRMEAKEAVAAQRRAEAETKLQGLVSEVYDDPDDFMMTMKRAKPGFQERAHRRQSDVPYEFEDISSDSVVSLSEMEEETASEPLVDDPKLEDGVKIIRKSSEASGSEASAIRSWFAKMDLTSKLALGAAFLVIVIVIVVVAVSI